MSGITRVSYERMHRLVDAEGNVIKHGKKITLRAAARREMFKQYDKFMKIQRFEGAGDWRDVEAFNAPLAQTGE